MTTQSLQKGTKYAYEMTFNGKQIYNGFYLLFSGFCKEKQAFIFNKIDELTGKKFSTEYYMESQLDRIIAL